MIAIDPNAPTEEEHKVKGVTKLSYLLFRDEQSSTCSHGFRIEAMNVSFYFIHYRNIYLKF